MQEFFKYFLGRFPKLLLVCPLFFVQNDQQAVDNLTILDSLTSKMVNRVIDQLAPDSTASFLIKSMNQNREGNWWIENIFAKKLIERGVSKLYINQQNIKTDFVVEFSLLDLGVRYNPVHKNDIVEREFDVKLAIRASEVSYGLVKLADEFQDKYADIVLIEDVKNLENTEYSFTQANLHQKEGLKKYIEPLIVVTTTVGVAYLFFRLRSN